MTEHERQEGHERTPGVFHESEAFAFRLIIWVGVGLAVIVVGVQVVLWGLLGGFEKYHTVPPGSVSELAREDAERPLGERVERVPAPRLEGIEPKSDPSRIAAARRRAEGQLERYGWIDRQKEIAHVPIEKAMEQILRSKELGSPTTGKRKRPEGGGRKR